MSLNFIDFIVAPLFVALTNLLPAAATVCGQLDYNRKKWHILVEGELRCSFFNRALQPFNDETWKCS